MRKLLLALTVAATLTATGCEQRVLVDLRKQELDLQRRQIEITGESDRAFKELQREIVKVCAAQGGTLSEQNPISVQCTPKGAGAMRLLLALTVAATLTATGCEQRVPLKEKLADLRKQELDLQRRQIEITGESDRAFKELQREIVKVCAAQGGTLSEQNPISVQCTPKGGAR
jgi:acetolactate synthase regulatory subunit